MNDINYKIIDKFYINQNQIFYTVIDNMNNIFLSFDKKMDNEELFKMEIFKVKKFKSLIHKNIIIMDNFLIKKKSNFCFKSYKINYFLEYNNLKSLNNYINDIGFWSIRDIENILFSAIEALEYLQKNIMYHGNLKLENIFLNEIKNNYKILMNYFNDNQYQNLKKNIYNSKKIYCSPELFNQFFNYSDYFNLNKYKEDSFQLGIIILELLGKDISKLYSFKSKKFNKKLLNNFLNELKNDLNLVEKKIKQDFIKLYEILILVLEVDQQKRYDFIGLKKYLIESKINNINIDLYNSNRVNKIKPTDDINLSKISNEKIFCSRKISTFSFNLEDKEIKMKRVQSIIKPEFKSNLCKNKEIN